MKYICFIFARGGSKGLKNKNIKNFHGKPLIAWSIYCASKIKDIGRIIISTDSEKIRDIALQYGAEAPFLRPSVLASDSSSEWSAWQHALNFLKDQEGYLPEAMISIPPTAPLRIPHDINQCIQEYEKGNSDAVITVSASTRNPYFNMVKKNINGGVSLVSKMESQPSRRQDAPEVFDIATVAYLVRSDFVLTHNSLFEGNISAIDIPKERSVDIDTEDDLDLANFYLEKYKMLDY